jgi:hypothetical protein
MWRELVLQSDPPPQTPHLLQLCSMSLASQEPIPRRLLASCRSRLWGSGDKKGPGNATSWALQHAGDQPASTKLQPPRLHFLACVQTRAVRSGQFHPSREEAEKAGSGQDKTRSERGPSKPTCAGAGGEKGRCSTLLTSDRSDCYSLSCARKSARRKCVLHERKDSMSTHFIPPPPVAPPSRHRRPRRASRQNREPSRATCWIRAKMRKFWGP